MRNNKILVVLAIALGFTAAKANAAGGVRLSPFVGEGFNSVHVQNSSVVDRDNAFAYGGDIEAIIGRDFGIETGAAFFKNRFQVPLMARFWGERTFTLAVGGVADSIKDQTTHIGAIVAPGLNFPLGSEDVSLFVEGRVMRLFADHFHAFNDRLTDLTALGGVRITIR